MRYYFIVFALMLGTVVRAQTQLNEEYFAGTLSGDLDKVYHSIEIDDGMIIVGSKSLPQGGLQGVILRLNQIGEVVWSTMPQTSQQGCSWVATRIKLFDDGYIYGYSFGCSVFCKIDVVNGQLMWISSNSASTYGSFPEMVDYDSTKFVVSYSTSQYSQHVALVDKSTGNLLSTVPMEYGNDIYQRIAVDPNGNIFYANGSTLHKFNGDNLNQRIWRKSYNLVQNDPDKIDVMTELYCDAHGDIFIWGYDDESTPDLILAKVSAIDGSVIWKIEAAGEQSLQDFKDRYNHLYMTFQHKYVGGNYGFFYTSKVNKDTGVENWFVWPTMTPLTTGCGNHEAAEVMDVDCNGDIYLNGYYGDYNYGPGIWGIMKLSGQNGTKDYELTIIQDSLICDNISEGVGVAVINELPIFVGNEEVSPYVTKATFVAVDTATALPSIRHHIGSDYQHFSSTVDIQNSGDSMFLLMQQGKQAILRMSTTFGVANWEFTDLNSNKTKAGCISINSNSAYLAINRLDTNNLLQSNYDSTNAVLFFKLNKSTGAIVQEDSLLISGNIHLIEMESDASGGLYLLYSDGTDLFLIRWDGNGLSIPITVGPVSANVQSGRPLNLLNNYSNSEILYSGDQDLYSIAKSTLIQNSIYSYPSPRNVYDLMHANGNIVLSGNTNAGIQSMLSIDTVNFVLNWDQTYQSGLFAGALFDQDTIYTFGEMNGQMHVKSLVASNGIAGWEYVRPNISSSSVIAYDLSFSPSNDKFVIIGSEQHLNNVADIAIDKIDRSGNGSSLLFVPDELNSQSFAYCSNVQFDSLLWVGGKLNRLNFGKQGFNYLFEFYQCIPDSSIETISACDAYSWIDGIIYTSTTTSPTFVFTNLNGCDSIVTLDLTINSVDASVSDYTPTLSANFSGATYQWVDCDNNYSPIGGEINQNFTPTVNGNYAVIVSDNGCSDTSLCFVMANVDLANYGVDRSVSISPNPTTGELKIDLGQEYANVEIEITTVQGQVVTKHNYYSVEDLNIELVGNRGVYFIIIRSEEDEKVFRVIKH